MATMTAASIDNLPDSDFAYIEPGGKKDSEGRTTPRSLRHFPIQDEAHVRNALARLSQSEFESQARPKVEAAARKFGIGAPGKAFVELKAEDFTHRQLDRWLAGEQSRRILVLPFGGPLPGGPKGKDLDGEYFDEATDIYGPFSWLRTNRERMVDWHHDDRNVPDPKASRMKGAIVGRIVLDDEPEEDGYWADWWAKAGERRLSLIKLLEKNHVPLYGSTEPVKGATHVEPDGHIDLWPIVRHTITTSPQNTWAVVPSLKAMLADPDIPFDEVGLVALKAALVGLDYLSADLQATLPDDDPAGEPAATKAGRVLSATNEAALRRALDELVTVPKLATDSELLRELTSP